MKEPAWLQIIQLIACITSGGGAMFSGGGHITANDIKSLGCPRAEPGPTAAGDLLFIINTTQASH